MNWKSPATALAIAVLLTLSTGTVSTAQEPEMSAEAIAEMNAWAKLAEPGEHHQHLAFYEGTWRTKIKMWMEPGAEPMLTESTAEAKWTMDGRFLEWTHTGNFAGMPYTGRGFDAYNNGDSRYESVWMDNFGTLMVFYTGECSDDGKTRVIRGSFTNPMAGSVIEQKNVYTRIDDDHFQVDSFMKMGDGEHKHMEMLYERQ